MEIIARARAFVESLQELARRRDRDWRECPRCHRPAAHKHGTYPRKPHTLQGREERPIQRYRCTACGSTHSQQPADLVPGSWYDRAVHRYAVDQWLHTGTSLRRVAEWVRSVIGRQERWQLWHPLSAPPPPEARCRLSHSTVHRWLDEAGELAERQTQGQYEGLAGSGLLGTDGLWARLRGGTVRVVLMLRDSVRAKRSLAWAAIPAGGGRGGRGRGGLGAKLRLA